MIKATFSTTELLGNTIEDPQKTRKMDCRTTKPAFTRLPRRRPRGIYGNYVKNETSFRPEGTGEVIRIPPAAFFFCKPTENFYAPLAFSFMSCAPPPRAPAATPLAPGFRFHPTDEELVSYYLKRKVTARPFRVDAISEIDLYRSDPWDLPGKSRLQTRDAEWYFFSALDKKYANRSRTNRGTGAGYWKTTGKDRTVCRGGRTVGMKKTLVFHVGRAPKGERTNWVMHEYRLEDEELARAGVPQDAFVVCRVFQKKGPGPQNGAQYGAPFVEEEWEDGEPPFFDEGDGEDASDGANKPVLTEVDGSEQSQDMGFQDESGAFLVDNGKQDDFSGFVDFETLLEIREDQELASGTHGNTEVHGWQNDQNLGTNIESVAADQNQIFEVLNDEFLELNDFAYPMVTHSRDDVVCPEEMQNEANLVNTEISSQKELDSTKNFINVHNESLDLSDELFPLSPTVENDCYVEPDDPLHLEPGQYSFGESSGGEMPYFDALSHYPDADLGLPIDMNNFADCSTAISNGPDAMDELIAYFDATENMQSSELDLEGGANASNQSNLAPIVSGYNPQEYQPSPEPSGIDGGNNSLSLETPESGKQSSFKSTGVDGELDALSYTSWDKTLSKRLVNMLGAISSPPAFAAEYPVNGAKSIERIPATHTSSSMHVTTGMIQIRGVTMSATGKNSSTPKNRDVGFVLSYGRTRNDESGNLAGSEMLPKMRGGVVAFILRNSFHLLFLSVLLLAATFKIWFCIHTR